MQMTEPYIEVGILHRENLTFSLNGSFRLNENSVFPAGVYTARVEGEQILFDGRGYRQLQFVPLEPDGSFDLDQVVIGIQFHWQREETQRFPGELKIIIGDGCLVAINRVLLETYLVSVISSEMKATASPALLRAHAVISRSWLLSQLSNKYKKQTQEPCTETQEEIVKWYDREDHERYDVCADDHCQRYQGITRVSVPEVAESVEKTRGEVLVYDDEICDARFSKCCGGVSERFENCWENTPHAYLTPVADFRIQDKVPDLTKNKAADFFIRSVPDAFCNTNNEAVLNQVLNHYDRETPDFYRWKVRYSQAELSALIRKKSGIDFGDILDLVPLTRGASGRIVRLQIAGTKKTFIIGKELLIRRVLSEAHLFSSAFVVDKLPAGKQIPDEFLLTGAGWGHGVGLCQIGAAVMGASGYSYREILAHYFRHAGLQRIY